MSRNEQDVLVIGGGLAGLAAATFIAREGKRVRLVEQSHAVGGRARTKEQGGFHLNIGPHALYRGGRGIEVLKELGITPRGGAPALSGAYAIRGGVKHTFPTGPVSLLTTSLFGLSAKLEVARFLASFTKIDCGRLMGVSLSRWLDDEITHAEVKDFLLASLRIATYANTPDLMSAGAAIEQLKLAFTKNVLYLDGGWQQIVDALARVAEQAGVIMETGAKVELIERDAAGRVRAARLADGRRLEAPVIIVASSPAIAASLVERGQSSSLARLAGRLVPARAASLDVALKRLPRPKITGAFGIDRPLYLSVHSAVARLAPDGGALIHVAKYLAPDDNDSPDAVRRELEGLLDTAQAGWRDSLIHSRFLPDLTVTHSIATAEGGGTSGRPGPQVPDVPGLFVVGDWVGKEGMLADASLASAKRAAELVAETGIHREQPVTISVSR